MARRSKPTAKRARTGARPLWRGHLKLSLVSCPVALYNAVVESEDIHLNFINPKTGNRIHYQPVDAETGKAVERDELVRGYQFQKDRYVTLTDEEIDALKIESSSTMNVEAFVPAEDIPPVYFERAYYVVPDGEAGAEAYAVIREAMTKSGMFAITRAVIARKERVLALKPEGKGLRGYALHEESDIRPERDLFKTIGNVKVDRDALSIAMKLVDQKTAKFDPDQFEDRYEARLRQLINAKLKGVELEPEEIAEEPKVVNLMDALKRSLGEGKGRRASRADESGERRSATVHKLKPRKKPAARGKAAARKKPAKARSRG